MLPAATRFLSRMAMSAATLVRAPASPNWMRSQGHLPSLRHRKRHRRRGRPGQPRRMPAPRRRTRPRRAPCRPPRAARARGPPGGAPRRPAARQRPARLSQRPRCLPPEARRPVPRPRLSRARRRPRQLRQRPPPRCRATSLQKAAGITPARCSRMANRHWRPTRRHLPTRAQLGQRGRPRPRRRVHQSRPPAPCSLRQQPPAPLSPPMPAKAGRTRSRRLRRGAVLHPGPVCLRRRTRRRRGPWTETRRFRLATRW
mmetsp:Transcript_1390/g.3305  ORF Transcript_1390/g.3305 Transcript_1390/m.3305 type:complete len:257 (-) Transcript_1390:566-1336(-)